MMKIPNLKIALAATIVAGAVFSLSGCSSDYSGGGDVDVHGSFYYGVGYSSGFYGPPYYGGGYYPPTVVVPPPRPPGGGGGGGMGGGPRPTPMPAMPRSGGGRR